MIRVIDMSKATSRPKTFAVYSTITDQFLADKNQDQTWEFEDFIKHFDPDIVKRVQRLLPWSEA